MIWILLYELQTILATECRIDFHFGVLQQSLHHTKVHLHIVHDQNPCFRGTEGKPRFLSLIQILMVAFTEVSHRSRIHNFLRYPGGKAGPLSIGTFYRNLSIHQLYQILGEIQSQSGSLNTAIAFFFQSGKGVKQLIHVFLPNPNTCIFYGNL